MNNLEIKLDEKEYYNMIGISKERYDQLSELAQAVIADPKGHKGDITKLFLDKFEPTTGAELLMVGLVLGRMFTFLDHPVQVVSVNSPQGQSLPQGKRVD